MRRKPKYLDRERRAARAEREFWEGVKWSPTQRKDFLWRIREGLIDAIKTPSDMFNGFTRADGDTFTGSPTLIR